jgi:hypothetical protein
MAMLSPCRRSLAASEPKTGKQLHEALTGGERVPARFMRGEFFEFKPVGKLFLTTKLVRTLNAPSRGARPASRHRIFPDGIRLLRR